MTTDHPSFHLRDKIAVIHLASPPVNSLGHALRTAVAAALQRAISAPEVEGILLMGAGKMFCGGAAIEEFDLPVRAEPTLRTIIDLMEASPKPILAAIHGNALGGGLELALGCHYRIATKDAKLGLPEVTLGLLPGGGGTQRLPRLIGVAAALELILTGTRIGAAEALACRLVDAVLDRDLEANAVAWLSRRLGDGTPAPLSARTVSPSDRDAPALQEARSKAAKKPGTQPAVSACIDCVEASIRLPFEEGLAFERQRFLELVASPTSKALRYLFFAEREVAKVPGLGSTRTTHMVGCAAVVGAGFMGTGIAMCFANAGIPVRILDLDSASLRRGLERIRATYGAMVERGKLAQQHMDERTALILPAQTYADLGTADLVVEAVYEDLEAKKQVFEQLSTVCAPDAILATNTSRLDIGEMAAASGRPGQVVGMHFFSPAHVMRLLEVVRAPGTSDTVLATTMDVGRRIGKLPVAVGMCDGFVGNRMVAVYLREAGFLLEEGAEPLQVDQALERFGMAMGPFAMMDMVGLDISWGARKRLAATRQKDLRYSHVADALCLQGRFGQKTGSGYYRYEPGSRTPLPDPEVTALIERCAHEAGFTRKPMTDEVIVERTIYALVNEGARILEEGIAARASDIDLIYVNGYGFPKWRGGPMFYAAQSGIENVIERIRGFCAEHGSIWTPARLLPELSPQGSLWKKAPAMQLAALKKVGKVPQPG